MGPRTSSVPRTALGPGREFDLIRRFMGDGGESLPGVLVGPGDDAVVLEGGLVVSTDMIVEDVHFRSGWIRWEEVGFRGVTAALSDLAAMGAEPLGVLVSLGLGSSGKAEVGEAVVEGAREACRAVDTAIIGGDLTGSPDPLILDVAVLGRAPSPMLRSGCRPGDHVWVTGRLGGAGACVDLWTLGQTPAPELRNAFARPAARIREALWLAEREIPSAAIDLSDGLGGDAAHLAAASGVALVLEETAVPIHSGVRELLGDSPGALRLALSGGEDYELCFTAPPKALEEGRVEEFVDTFELLLTRVGRVEEGEGVLLEGANGDVRRLRERGFQHLGEGTDE